MSPSRDPRADRWMHRPDVWSGLFLGNAIVGRAFRPSLMPRTSAHQGLVAGATGAIGFALGQAAYGLGARTGSALGDAAVLGGAAAVGFGVSRALPEHGHERDWRPLVRTGGSVVAASSAAALAGVLVEAQPRSRRFYVGAGTAAVAALTGARAIVQGVRDQRDAHTEYDPPPPTPLPAVTNSVAVAAVVGGLLTGFRRTTRGLRTMLHRRIGLPEVPSRWLGRGLAVGVWFGTGKALADTFVSGLRLYDRVVDPGLDRAPASPFRSAGPGSGVGFARLGREGRKFVLNAPSADDVSRVMGGPAQEPIRVFVGYAAARTDEERVALAVEELRRTGAFDRGLLVVGCPAGNGYVNTLPLEVLDYVLAGDTAAVAVQYGRLPSFLTLRRVTRGGRVQRQLLEAIQAELADRAPGDRPRIVCYGESLGAWSGQDTFLHRGVTDFDDLGVDRALWAGTPYYSGWRREVLVDGAVPVPVGCVVEVGRPEDLLVRPADELARIRAVLLVHGNDPVAYLAAGLLVRRPDWLRGERPWGVPDDMGWLPGVTAVQVIVDAVNATRPVPGVFRATGHEYNADLPEITLAAYGVPAPDVDTWDRLVAHLADLDAARAAARRLPRRDDTGEPALVGDGVEPAGA